MFISPVCPCSTAQNMRVFGSGYRGSNGLAAAERGVWVGGGGRFGFWYASETNFKNSNFKFGTGGFIVSRLGLVAVAVVGRFVCVCPSLTLARLGAEGGGAQGVGAAQ